MILMVCIRIHTVNEHLLAQQRLDFRITGFGPLPNRIQRSSAAHLDATAWLVAWGRCVGGSAPAQEGIPVAGRLLRGDSKGVRFLILRSRLIGLAGRCAGAAVGVIVQRKGGHNRHALEVIVRGVLAIGKQSTITFASTAAAASGPGDVVHLVVVNAFPDILRIGKFESIIVDIILAQANGDVMAVDAYNRIAIDLVTDTDLDTRHRATNSGMQHNGAGIRFDSLFPAGIEVNLVTLIRPEVAPEHRAVAARIPCAFT